MHTYLYLKSQHERREKKIIYQLSALRFSRQSASVEEEGRCVLRAACGRGGSCLLCWLASRPCALSMAQAGSLDAAPPTSSSPASMALGRECEQKNH